MKFSACGVEDLGRFDPNSNEEAIILKIQVNGNNIVEQHLTPSLSKWTQLNQMLTQLFGQPPEKLSYVDEEGDQVSLGSDLEWEEALKVARTTGNMLHLCYWSPSVNGIENNAQSSVSDRDQPLYEVINEGRNYRSSQDLGSIVNGHFSVSTFQDNQAAMGEDYFAAASAASPPLWFTTYMDKWKQEIIAELAKKIGRRLQKQLASSSFSSSVNSFPVKAVELSVGQSATEDDVATALNAPFQNLSLEDVAIGHGVSCQNCHTDIVGIRYKCGNCFDFDLCEACEANPRAHKPEHVFIKIRKPGKIIVSEGKGKLRPLLRGKIYSKENKEQNGGPQSCPEKTPVAKNLQQSLHASASVELGASKAMNWDRMQKALAAKFDQVRPVRATMDAEFLLDETVPDGTKVPPGFNFTKQWRIVNSGCRPWDRDTLLKFLWGTKGFAPDEMEVAVPPLEPRQSGSVGVRYTAPLRPGHYESHWNFVHKGHLFGHRIWCSIEVVNPGANLVAADSVPLMESAEVQEPENGEKQEVIEVESDKVAHGVLPVNLEQATERKQSSDDTLSVSTPPKLSSVSTENAISAMDGTSNAIEEADDPESDLSSVVSLSSEASDSEFVVVPMPPCFDIPFVPKRDGGSSTNGGPLSPHTPQDVCGKFSSSGSSVVFIKSDSEESPNGTPLNENSPIRKEFGIDHSYALTSSVPSETSRSDQSTVDNDSEVLYTDVVTPDGVFANEVEVETSGGVPPTVKVSQISLETGESVAVNKSAVSTTEDGFVCGSPQTQNESGRYVKELFDDDRTVNVLPEGLVSAAAHIFNSARTALSALQWVPLPPDEDERSQKSSDLRRPTEPLPRGTPSVAVPVQSSVPESPASLANVLWEMGFCNSMVNASVIEKHCGDLDKVIDELLRQYDNDWYAHRH